MSMTMMETHRNLIRWLDKPESELYRKALKSARHKQKIWTQEQIDYSEAVGKRYAEFFECFDN